MGRSKWNRGNSIPISSLSDWQLVEAIQEWSEGNIHLENLLWNCYNNGVYTGGCDAGEHHFGYIDFIIEDSERSALKRILKAVQKFDVCILLHMTANPYSGSNWYKSSISILPIKNKDANEVFDVISAALVEKSTVSDDELIPILEFYDFLKDKEAGLNVRVKIHHGKYRFFIESHMNERNWEHFTNLFEKAGFKKDEDIKTDSPVMKWGFKVKDQKEATLLALKGLKVIKENWTLKPPKTITEDMSFNSKARIMLKKFGTTKRGEKKLQKWLKNHKKEFYK